MDLNEKPEQPGQEQNQDQAGNVGAAQEPEPARECKICHSPNHHGCGCEAKQLREAEEGSAMNHDRGEPQPEARQREANAAVSPASKVLFPEPQPALDWFHQKLSEEEREMAQRLYDNFENISINLMDIVNLLKLNNKLLQVISSDAMATRATLQKMEAKMNNGKDTNQN